MRPISTFEIVISLTVCVCFVKSVKINIPNWCAKQLACNVLLKSSTAFFISGLALHADYSRADSVFPDIAMTRVIDDSTTDTIKSKSSNVILPSGEKYFDEIVGKGDVAVEKGRTVQFLWVLRRPNGYFVDSSSNYNNEPVIYRVGNMKAQKVIQGIDEGIRGMKAGGVRRLMIPPDLAYVKGMDEEMPGPILAEFGPRRQIISSAERGENLVFEIKVLRVK